MGALNILGAVSLMFRSSFLLTNYAGLGANLISPLSVSETAPRFRNRYSKKNLHLNMQPTLWQLLFSLSLILPVHTVNIFKLVMYVNLERQTLYNEMFTWGCFIEVSSVFFSLICTHSPSQVVPFEFVQIREISNRHVACGMFILCARVFFCFLHLPPHRCGQSHNMVDVYESYYGFVRMRINVTWFARMRSWIE